MFSGDDMYWIGRAQKASQIAAYNRTVAVNAQALIAEQDEDIRRLQREMQNLRQALVTQRAQSANAISARNQEIQKLQKALAVEQAHSAGFGAVASAFARESLGSSLLKESPTKHTDGRAMPEFMAVYFNAFDEKARKLGFSPEKLRERLQVTL
jgi:hypothetical protein